MAPRPGAENLRYGADADADADADAEAEADAQVNTGADEVDGDADSREWENGASYTWYVLYIYLVCTSYHRSKSPRVYFL